jgi:hypothetical protein
VQFQDGVDTPPGESFATHIAIISIDYSMTLTWSGQGTVPPTDEAVLATARRLAATYGVQIRVHHVPEERRIYTWLLSEGVALIGAQDLPRNRTLLRE